MHKTCDVLILTAKFGRGHVSVSEAIREHVQLNDNALVVEMVDFYEIINPYFYKSMYKGYEMLIKKGHHIYNMYYYRKNESDGLLVMDAVTKSNLNRLKKKMAQLKPKVIVSTFPVCASYMDAYKKSEDPSVKTVTCITDVLENNEWINETTDTYFVASEAMKQHLVGKGIKRERIIVTGIPVRNAFTKSKSKIDLRHLYGFSRSEKIILMMGGGLGLLPEDEVFYKTLLSEDKNLKVVVVTGNNHLLYKKLSKLEEPRLKILKYTKHIAAYMTMADVLVSKAGGITLFEAIASEIPMVVYKPILGQEMGNCAFVEQHHIGAVTYDNDALIEEVMKLLYNKAYMEHIHFNIRKQKDVMKMKTMSDYLTNMTVENTIENRIIEVFG